MIHSSSKTNYHYLPFNYIIDYGLVMNVYSIDALDNVNIRDFNCCMVVKELTINMYGKG